MLLINASPLLEDGWKLCKTIDTKKGKMTVKMNLTSVPEVIDAVPEDMYIDVYEKLKKLLTFFKDHPACRMCKHYDKESPNYGYTDECRKCGWYPWANDELPYLWDWNGKVIDDD